MSRRPTTRLAAAVALVGLVAGCGASHKQAAAVTQPTAVATTPAAATPPAPPTYSLTGLPVTDAAMAARPALSVKIDNVTGSFPQAGLNQADIVVDALVEGGLTRLFAIYQSQVAGTVGPIRSARPVDADLLRLVGGGYFAYSGAALGEIAPTIDHGDATRIAYGDFPQAYFRLRGYASPHNLFASTPGLYRAGVAAGRRNAATPVFTYSAKPGAGAVPAHSATVPISGSSSAGWTWDGRKYLRSQNGSPDSLADGSRVSATNIVIMSIAVRGTGIFDQAHNEDPLDVVIGSGQCWVLRNGLLYKGRWTRPSVGARMVLTDSAGHVLALQPGRTWLELMPRPGVPRFA